MPIKMISVILCFFLLSSCSFDKKEVIGKVNQEEKETLGIENVFASDYLYKYKIINKKTDDTIYYRSGVNYGSVVYSLVQYLNSIHGESIYSEAKLLSLINEFDKYSRTKEYSIIQCYFQLTEAYKYVFNPEFITPQGEFCISITYIKGDKEIQGYFVFYPENEIFKYYKEKPTEQMVVNKPDLNAEEARFILLNHLYENLYTIYANNSGINQNERIFEVLNVSFTEYISVITPLITKDLSYVKIVNSYNEELNNMKFSNVINNAILTNCMFKKICWEFI